MTELLKNISETHSIALSTLKFNSRVLRELDLISFGKGHSAELTERGEYVAKILGDGDG